MEVELIGGNAKFSIQPIELDTIVQHQCRRTVESWVLGLIIRREFKAGYLDPIFDSMAETTRKNGNHKTNE